MAEIYRLDSSSETNGIAEFAFDFQGQSFKKHLIIKIIKNGENAITWLLMIKIIVISQHWTMRSLDKMTIGKTHHTLII